MANSIVNICNLALFNVGSTASIASLTERSKEAQVCAQVYDITRDAVLAQMAPAWATRRAALADTGEVPAGWQYGYAYPADCLKITDVLPAGMRAVLPGTQRIAFDLTMNAAGTGRLLACDLPQADACYIQRIEDPTLYPPLFVQTLAWGLAAAICVPLKVDGNTARAAQERYMAMLSAASASAANERYTPANTYGTAVGINEARFA